MTVHDQVAAHYTRGSLVASFEEALRSADLSRESLTVDDLAPADEFHIGGRQATLEFLGQLAPGDNDRLLDIGCGLGGPARTIAAETGCHVTGVDLTTEFIETATVLSDWLGLGSLTEFLTASALEMPFEDGRFDAATMFHVGMNIEDKAALFREVRRVLRPAGLFGIYDVMRTGQGDIHYPVPWAATPETSFVDTVEVYRTRLADNGFMVIAERERTEFAVAFFDQMRDQNAKRGGPPPVGLHLVMGPDAPQKVGNMVANLKDGVLAPVELVARAA